MNHTAAKSGDYKLEIYAVTYGFLLETQQFGRNDANDVKLTRVPRGSWRAQKKGNAREAGRSCFITVRLFHPAPDSDKMPVPGDIQQAR